MAQPAADATSGCYSTARTWVGGEELKQAKSTAAADFSTSTTASTLRRSLSFERFRKKKLGDCTKEGDLKVPDEELCQYLRLFHDVGLPVANGHGCGYTFFLLGGYAHALDDCVYEPWSIRSIHVLLDDPDAEPWPCIWPHDCVLLTGSSLMPD